MSDGVRESDVLLHHMGGCQSQRLHITRTRGTLPWLIWCDSASGGCGRWSELSGPTGRRALNDPTVTHVKDSAPTRWSAQSELRSDAPYELAEEVLSHAPARAVQPRIA